MTNDRTAIRRNSSKTRANLLNLLMFLTGACIGCAAMRLWEIEGTLFQGSSSEREILFHDLSGSFVSVMLANGKFLLLIFLLAFLRCGAVLVPPLFGMEGALIGSAATAVVATMHYHGAVLLSILLLFRLIFVLPYGFLLGTWSIGQSLSFEHVSEFDRQSRIRVFLLTLAVLLAASFLECTLARWLGGIYYLKVGV